MSTNRFTENLNYIKNRLKHMTDYDVIKNNMVERICKHLEDDIFYKAINNYMSLDLLNACCYHISRSGISNCTYVSLNRLDLFLTVDFEEMILELDSRSACFDFMTFLCDGCGDCCERLVTSSEEKKLFDFTILESIINVMIDKCINVYKKESGNYFSDEDIDKPNFGIIDGEISLFHLTCRNFFYAMKRSIEYYNNIVIRCNS